jgi:hypothetical protein
MWRMARKSTQQQHVMGRWQGGEYIMWAAWSMKNG